MSNPNTPLGLRCELCGCALQIDYGCDCCRALPVIVECEDCMDDLGPVAPEDTALELAWYQAHHYMQEYPDELTELGLCGDCARARRVNRTAVTA